MGEWITREMLGERLRRAVGDPQTCFLNETTELFVVNNPGRKVLIDVFMLPHSEQIDPIWWRFIVIIYLWLP